MYAITRKKDKLQAKFEIRADTSDENSILEVWKKNSYQRKLFQVEKNERWLDLGSNIGSFTVYAALKGCTVRAYEADEYNAGATDANIHWNSLTGVARVQRAAIVHDGYEGGHVSFFVNERPMALRRHSIHQPKKNFTEIKVPAITFSELPLDHTDGIKMNIEGAEIELLERAKGFGAVRKLVFEYSWDKDPSIARFQAIVARLKTHFRVVDYNKRLPETENWVHYPPHIFVYCMV